MPYGKALLRTRFRDLGQPPAHPKPWRGNSGFRTRYVAHLRASTKHSSPNNSSSTFTLNQDLLLEIHYMQMFGAQPRWSGVLMPGMRALVPAPGTGPFDFTMTRWRPTNDFTVHEGCQPFFKLHGSSNWETGKRIADAMARRCGAFAFRRGDGEARCAQGLDHPDGELALLS